MTHKFKNVLLWPALLAGLLATSASCGKIERGKYAQGSAKICCDDGFRRIMEEEIEVFEYSYPEASIIPFYLDEQQCFDSLMADRTQAIVVTKEITPDQKKFIEDKFRHTVRCEPIAVDAVALIVNKDNPIESLSVDEIGKIMNGQITDWKQLAVNDTARIQIVFDSQGSSTVSYMRQKFLPQGRLISQNPNARAQKGNAEVFDIVKKDPSSLGIISVSWLGDDLSAAKKIPVKERMESYSNENDTIATALTTEVKVLKVSNPTAENDFSPVAYKPYQVYINSGEYPLFRKVYMISTGPNSSVMHSFYTFVTGFVGQKIISMTGIMPYHFNRRVVQLQ